MKKFISAFIFSFFGIPMLFSQTVEETNLARYWKYRDRFSTYFTYKGSQNGEGHVVCIRHRQNPSNGREYLSQLCYGQHGIHFGYYLGMLATEHLLLSIYDQTSAATNTLEELRMAITAYKEQMDKCENLWGKEEIVDGFFVRENVPLDFLEDSVYGAVHSAHFNQGLTKENVWDVETQAISGVPKGHPGWVDEVSVRINGKEPMSQDEAYGVMMGLALVARCVPELKEEASILFEMITLHIINKNPNYYCSGIGYYIYNPDCSKVSENFGGITSTLGYGIAAATAAITGKDMIEFMNPYNNKQVKAKGEKPYNRKLYDRLTQKWSMKLLWNTIYNGVPGEQSWNRAMVATLAAMGDSWHPHTAKGIENNVVYKSKKSEHDWRIFYLALWRFLHNQPPGNFSEKSLTLNDLATAPWDGPYNFASSNNPDNHAKNGWAHEYKYRGTFVEQYHGFSHKGVYNGLDYMLMYNLYHLIYASADTDIPYYLYPNTNNEVLNISEINPNWDLKNRFAFEQKIKKK